MKRAEMPNMTRDSSYPSPPGAQMSEGAHPFYPNQRPLPPNEQLSGQPPVNEGSSNPVLQRSPTFSLQGYRQEMASPQQLAQTGLESAASTAKARSKVSRACDECRRKKMRCDAEVPCSNCQKAGITCTFANPPGKRGPSKGYIKQLADRVDFLEGNLPYGAVAYAAQPEDGAYGSRKRTHSMSEGMQNPRYAHSDELSERHQSLPSTNWTNHGISGHTQALQSPAAPQSQSLQQGLNYVDTVSNTQTPHTSPDEVMLASRPVGGMDLDAADARAGEPDSHTDSNFEWDEKSVDEYYRLMHPVLPILPSTKAKMRFNLTKVPTAMRDGLIYALNAAAPAADSSVGSSIKKAAEQLAAVQLEDLGNRSVSENLVYLQALLLMSLASSASGPTKAPQSAWFNQALNVAISLGLHLNHPHEHVAGSDLDTNGKLCRRAWLAFVVMDRWHAAGLGVPQLTNDSQAKLYPQDTELLGDVGTRFARLSNVLGHLLQCSITNVPFPHFLTSHQVLYEIQAEFCRDNSGPVFNAWPVLHMAYWHIKLLLQPHTVHYDHALKDPQGMAIKLTAILCNSSAALFAHHFVTLAATGLFNALAYQSQNKDIKRALEDLWTGLNEGRVLPGPSRGGQIDKKAAWDTALMELIGNKLQEHQQQQISTNETAIDRGGLQHLADAAVGESENLGGGAGTGAGAGNGVGIGEKGKEAPATVLEVEAEPPRVYIVGPGYLRQLFL